MIETAFDTLNAKAAIWAIESTFEALGRRCPLMISGTITDASGRTLSGQTPSAFWTSVAHAQPLLVGFNCALGAAQLRPHMEELAHALGTRVSVHVHQRRQHPIPSADTAEHMERWRACSEGSHARGS